MNRRRFLATTSAALAGTVALAGCSSSSQAPPRESEVFQTIKWTDGALKVVLEDTPVVESRVDADASDALASLAALSPVGVASAGGRGGRGGRSGGRGSGSSSARGRNGRHKLHGGAYAGWHDDHDDEVEEYQCQVTECGVARIGPPGAEEDDLPGPGPVEWDKKVTNPDDSFQHEVSREGWYRVGSHLKKPSMGHDFGWEAVDFELQDLSSGSYAVSNEWKVSPRL